MTQYWEGVEGALIRVCKPAANSSESAPAVSPGYFLATKRLGFRCWAVRDEDLAINLWCNPQVTALIGGPWTRDVALERLAREIEQQNQYGMQYWPIFLLVNGRHAGCAGVRPYEAGKTSYEMGVHLLPEFWGQGIAREAAEAIIPYTFGPLDATAIVAGHHPRNAASGRLLMKLGFAYQGDKLYIPTGLMHPMYWLRRDQAASG
jgi:RimJ/RimL family protein N-acetyltransferase